MWITASPAGSACRIGRQDALEPPLPDPDFEPALLEPEPELDPVEPLPEELEELDAAGALLFVSPLATPAVSFTGLSDVLVGSVDVLLDRESLR